MAVQDWTRSILELQSRINLTSVYVTQADENVTEGIVALSRCEGPLAIEGSVKLIGAKAGHLD